MIYPPRNAAYELERLAAQASQMKELFDRLDAAQLSLRDYFAVKAMQGLLAAQIIYGFNDRPAKGPFASMADAMLKAREASNEQAIL